MPSADGSALRLIEITVPAAAAEAAADVLLALGVGGVYTEGLRWAVPGDDVLDARGAPAALVAVRAAVPEEGSADLLWRVGEGLGRRPWIEGAKARLVEAPRVDWVREYQRHLRAVEILPGLHSAPGWDSVPGRREIRIEPGAAFGSGDHPTTRTALRLLARHLRPGDDVIDLGCGSGILGAVALMLGAAGARLYDTDPLAVATARRTMRQNHLRARVFWRTLPPRARACDLLVANIAASALRPMLGAIRRAVRPGGTLVAGGILVADEGFAQDLQAAGLLPFDRESEGDWQAVAARAQ